MIPACRCGQPALVVSFSGYSPTEKAVKLTPGVCGFGFSWCGSCVHDLRDDVATIPAPRAVRS